MNRLRYGFECSGVKVKVIARSQQGEIYEWVIVAGGGIHIDAWVLKCHLVFLNFISYSICIITEIEFDGGDTQRKSWGQDGLEKFWLVPKAAQVMNKWTRKIKGNRLTQVYVENESKSCDV